MISDKKSNNEQVPTAPLWRIPFHKADPAQRRIVVHLLKSKKNAWVKGFAGSGKTQVLYWFAQQSVTTPPRAEVPSICFVLFTRGLTDLVSYCLGDLRRKVDLRTLSQFSKETKRYDVILVDEIQDLKCEDLRLIKERCGRLIVAGDPAQSIYRNRASEKDIVRMVGGETHPLPEPHRLSKPLAELAQSFFPEAGVVPPKKNPPVGAGIEHLAFEDLDSEVDAIWKIASRVANNRNRSKQEQEGAVAILLPNHKEMVSFCQRLVKITTGQPWVPEPNRWDRPDYGKLNQLFFSNDLDIQFFGSGYGSITRAARSDWINLMTYYSAKGLDFGAVLLPYLSSDTMGYQDRGLAKRVFFVAITRARDNLVTSYCDNPNDLLKQLSGSSRDVSDELSDLPF